MAEAMMKDKDNLIEPAASTRDASSSKGGPVKGREKKVVPPPAVASTSKGKPGNPVPTPTPPTSKSSVPAAAMNFNTEAIAILREMNANQNKTNAAVEKLSQRVDELYNMQDCQELDYEAEPVPGFDGSGPSTSYDYDESYGNFDNAGYYEEEIVTVQSEASPKRPADEVEDNVFAPYLKKFKKQDSVDKDVALPLADIVNNAFREGMPDDVYNELTKGISRPGNCITLKETRVNQGVWSVLKPNTQTEDSKMRGVQNAVVKATINLTKMLDAGASSFDQKLMDWGTDAIAILGQANKWLNVRRKELHKRDMDPKLHYLCSSSLQSTDQLYGDSIIKDIKDAQEFNKISRQVGARGRGFRGRGRNFRGRMRGNFYQNKRRGSMYGYQGGATTKASSSTPSKNSKTEHKK